MPWRTKKSQDAVDATEAFAELVIEYKELLEELAADPSQETFTKLHANLVAMVSGVLILKDKIWYPKRKSNDNAPHGAPDYKKVYGNLFATLDPLETRLAAKNGILEGAIEWRGSLSYHLGDIYDDVMVGLHHYQQGGQKERKRAAGHWKLGFQIHWGQNHIYNALFILHYFVYSFEDLEDDD